MHGVGATFDDCCLPFAVGVTAHCLVEGHGVPSRELPAAGTEPPLQTRTSCSQAAAPGTAGGIEQSGTPSSPASYRPPASQCAKAGEESPARVCVWPAGGGGGWLQLRGNRCLLCSLMTSKKRTYHQHGVTEGAPEAPRSGEVPCSGRSEARLEMLSARWSASRQPPHTLALRGSPSALWPSSAPAVQAPSLNSLLLPQGSPRPPLSSSSHHPRCWPLAES